MFTWIDHELARKYELGNDDSTYIPSSGPSAVARLCCKKIKPFFAIVAGRQWWEMRKWVTFFD